MMASAGEGNDLDGSDMCGGKMCGVGRAREGERTSPDCFVEENAIYPAACQLYHAV